MAKNTCLVPRLQRPCRAKRDLIEAWDRANPADQLDGWRHILLRAKDDWERDWLKTTGLTIERTWLTYMRCAATCYTRWGWEENGCCRLISHGGKLWVKDCGQILVDKKVLGPTIDHNSRCQTQRLWPREQQGWPFYLFILLIYFYFAIRQ